MSAPTQNTLITAQGLASLGISVLKMRPDFQKRPDGNWKEYQKRRATNNEINRWFAAGAPIGVVTGAVSGNLTMAEIEGRAAHRIPDLEQVARDSGLGDVWDKINTSWVERSPSGGIHWFYRTEEPPAGNQKLAGRASTPEELAAWKTLETAKAHQSLQEPQLSTRLDKIARSTERDVWQVLTETRGEGGYVVAAPTPGQYHESGRPWEWINTPDHLVTLTAEEADKFLTILRSIDEPLPEPEQPKRSPFAQTPSSAYIDGTRPGDDFDRETWENILEPHGWRKLHTVGKTQYWLRPGKEARDGHSASTNHADDRDRMWVFTTSTELPAETPLTKFAVHTQLNHGGNYSAAASELAKRGWGRPAEILVSAPPRTLTSTGGQDTRQDNPGSGRIDQKTTVPTNSPPPSTAATATVTDIAEKRARKLTTLAQSDDGNASLFVNEHISILRYNPESGRWLQWENTVWRQMPGKDGPAVNLARQTVRSLPRGNETERAWAKKSTAAGAIKAIVSLAKTDPQIIVYNKQLDALPWELNTPQGPVNLKTGKLLPPDREKFHTKQTICAPDFGADRSRWLQFLAETFPGNQPMIDYIQRLAGYTLIGQVKEHIIPFALGSGGNGKGVLIETMAGILGEYAGPVNPNLLMKQYGTQHPTELTTLDGLRMAVSSEINPSAKFDEARVNLLTGGDKINARGMGQDEYSFEPTHQLWLSGNHQPAVEGGGGNGFWRRLRVIPFNHTVPEERADTSLKEKFTGELAPAILAWMIEGAVAYYTEGGLASAEPQQVKQATEEYQKDTQTVARFLEEECIVGNPDDTVPCRKLIDRYKAFCEDMGAVALKGKKLGSELRAAGVLVGEIRSGAAKYYGNVRLAFGQNDQEFKPPDYSPGAAIE